MEIDTYTDIAISNGTPIDMAWTSDSLHVNPQTQLAHLIIGYSPCGWGKMRNSIKPMDVSGEASIKWEWGDKDGSKISVEASASASNDKGDYIEVSASQDSDGKGDVEVTIGTERESK
ncbi:MAG: hypothetical protein K1X28_05350 [Parachlamydiales bacterium]|nr:hypothetical protein [Parachlamydiales bacterium]